MAGIDPAASRMLSGRSTIWATPPIWTTPYSVWAGFEPTRAMPIGFQVQRLNHSAITPLASRRDRTIGLTLTKRMLYQLSYRSKKPTPKTSFNNYLKFRLLLLFIMFRTILIKTTERIMYGFGFWGFSLLKERTWEIPYGFCIGFSF